MANSTLQLFKATPSLSIEQQADLARTLISANELYKRSNNSVHSHEERKNALQEASTLAHVVLSQLPNDVSALNLVARIEMDQGKHNSAELLLRAALGIAPKDENSRLNYAYVLMAKRQYGEAQALFLDILQDHRNSVRAFSGIALAKLRQRDYFGAFSHYRRLLELGHDGPQLRAGLLEAAEFLHADSYQRELETLLITAFGWDNCDHQKLANLAGGLLIAKYKLNDANAILDLQCLLKDPLLLAALSKCVIPDIAMESLVRDLRKTLMQEISQSKQLRDEIVPFAIAIGHYANRTDYALMLDQEEELAVQALVHEVAETVHGHWTIEDVSGALITLSMYEALYTLPCSAQLLREDLEAWPFGMQSLLNLNLYELSREHMQYYELFGFSHDALLDNGIKRASNRWQQLNSLSRSSLYTALAMALSGDQIPERFKDQPLSVLVVGCGSGQRAFYLAECFDNVTVYAVDPSQHNIAYANMKVRESGKDNVRFIHSELETALISEEPFDMIEFSEALNHVQNPQQVIAEWLPLLADDGLVRFNLHTRLVEDVRSVIIQLVKERRLSPTADNIRHLRNAITQEASSGLWNALLTDERFYTATGCQNLFFQRFNHCFDLEQVDQLLKTCQLRFSGFVDLPELLKQKARPLAPTNLLAWHSLDQEDHMFGECYCLYGRKR